MGKSRNLRCLGLRLSCSVRGVAVALRAAFTFLRNALELLIFGLVVVLAILLSTTFLQVDILFGGFLSSMVWIGVWKYSKSIAFLQGIRNRISSFSSLGEKNGQSKYDQFD